MTNLVSASSNSLTVVDEFPRTIKEHQHFQIPLSDGVNLGARMWLPEDAATNPVPVIIEYLPYRQRDFTAPRDAVIHPWFAGHGYAAIRVDIRGSGDSDGDPMDEYVIQEQDDALEVLQWIVDQPWCSGLTGMIGISWGGFNALQIAARRPESLKAIITVCSTDDRYHDDVHYMGGCLLSNNTTWGSTMSVYMGRPPDPMVVGERWREMWRQRIIKSPVTLMTWLAHPFRDTYWKHGSVCENYGSIDCAVYSVGGWMDGYSNAIPRLLRSLSAPRLGVIGPWAHGYPHLGVPGPNIGFLQEAVKFWDRWLKNIDNGFDREPILRAWMQQRREPVACSHKLEGRWIGESELPNHDHEFKRFALNVDGLTVEPGEAIDLALCSPLNTGIAMGEWCPHGLGPELSLDQRQDDSNSLVFDSAPLTNDLEILGAPALTVKISSDKPVAMLAVRLSVLSEDGCSSRVTFGVLNLCHRDSHETPSELEPGKTCSIVVKLNDVAQHFPAGSRIRLALSSSLWPMFWPAPAHATLSIRAGESFLWLPVRPIDAEEIDRNPYEPAKIPKPKAMRWLRQVSRERKVETDQVSGRTCITYDKDDGAYFLEDIEMEVDAVGTEQHCITAGDPLSAEQTVTWAIEHRRDGWCARVESEVKVSCTATDFKISMKWRGFEGEKLIIERDESGTIPRKFI